VAQGSREKKLFVEINASGRPKPSEPARERLASNPGLWKLASEIGRLMVLERVVDNRDRSRVGKSREVVLAGVFDDAHQLASVLDYVQMASLDGSMHVDSGEVRATLFFRRGVYLAGHSNLRSDRLGAVLVRAGLIDEQALDQVISEVGHGARLGNRLVQKGLLTTPQVYEGLRIQAEEIFYALMRLSSGSYHLVSPLDMTAVPAMLRLDLKQLLMEGVRRLDESAASRDAIELRQRKPIPSDRLPPDGVERIFDAYNDALRALFQAVGDSDRDELRHELDGFLEENEAYAALFDGAIVQPDGSLGIEVLENLQELEGGDPVTRLQLGLNEMLFFLMFAAGDALPPQVEQVVQWRVAEALEKLPSAG
jgi:hypothetical protein